MKIDKYEDLELYRNDSQFEVVKGLAGIGISISIWSKNYPEYYFGHAGYECIIRKSDGSHLFKEDVTWLPVPGLADRSGVSFTAYNYHGYYMRHSGYKLKIEKTNNTRLFHDDATWYPEQISSSVNW